MLVVTAISAKGGSGKTTLIQMLASAMLARGRRVHVMDADADKQILEWESKSARADFGDSRMVVQWLPLQVTLAGKAMQ